MLLLYLLIAQSPVCLSIELPALRIRTSIQTSLCPYISKYSTIQAAQAVSALTFYSPNTHSTVFTGGERGRGVSGIFPTCHFLFDTSNL